MGRAEANQSGLVFEQAVPIILDRWTAERNTRVSDEELAQARDYLERRGVRVRPVDGGRFVVEDTGRLVEAAHVVLMGVRYLAAARVQAFVKH